MTARGDNCSRRRRHRDDPGDPTRAGSGFLSSVSQSVLGPLVSLVREANERERSRIRLRSKRKLTSIPTGLDIYFGFVVLGKRHER